MLTGTWVKKSIHNSGIFLASMLFETNNFFLLSAFLRRSFVLATHDFALCAYWSKKLLAESLFISCAPLAIYKQINFLPMKPTTKQLKLPPLSLYERDALIIRVLREKTRSTSKGCCWVNAWREKMRSQIILLWMRDEKRSSSARSDFVYVLTNQSILPSSPISAAGCVLLAPLLLNTNTFRRCAPLKVCAPQSICTRPSAIFCLLR